MSTPFHRDRKKYRKNFDEIDWGSKETTPPAAKKKKSTKEQVNIVIKVK